MKNIKNSIVFKNLVAFAFILVVAVVVTFGKTTSKTDSIPNHQEVSKSTFEIGGSSHLNKPYDVEIGGENATRILYSIGGNGGGNGSAPRNIHDIGGSQSLPQRQISETSSNDYAIGLHVVQETGAFSDIGGNSVPRNVQEIGGSQSLPQRQNSESSLNNSPIGGNTGQQRSLSVTNSLPIRSVSLNGDLHHDSLIGGNANTRT